MPWPRPYTRLEWFGLALLIAILTVLVFTAIWYAP